MLVYEYMPQGPLSLHLFEWAAAGLRPLEWKQRLSIALDVARGVEYLHSLAQTSFIHRDLKPSNILLGDDMRAKVSDFELVKLAPDRKFSVESRLAGTFGYLAPEYAGTHGITPFHSIGLDVARGVEYLHSLAQTTFIHRDLKPSNILLGDDMRAKVSDFELVKLAPDGKFSVETRLADTFGYLDPEYAGTHGITPFHSIALDVARGVEYLHSLAQTTFIHRDLKPSNILLGNDMRPRSRISSWSSWPLMESFLLKPGWPALLVIWSLNTQWLKRKKKNALYEALEKLKAELMLLGFISLLLTVGAKPISMICISKKVGDTMLPCKTNDTAVESTAVESMKVDNGEEHGRKRLWESMSSEQKIPWRRVLAGAGEDSNYCSSAHGNYPLVSPTGMNQLHIFIFLLAVLHVLYSVLTVALARAKMKRWKACEQETQTLEYEFSHG